MPVTSSAAIKSSTPHPAGAAAGDQLPASIRPIIDRRFATSLGATV